MAVRGENGFLFAGHAKTLDRCIQRFVQIEMSPFPGSQNRLSGEFIQFFSVNNFHSLSPAGIIYRKFKRKQEKNEESSEKTTTFDYINCL